MKAQFTLTIALAALCLSFSNAQTFSSPINIVPTATPGIIKVIYAAQPEAPVEVTFSSERGEIQKDKIKVGVYPKGVAKIYDVRKISKTEFHIRVSSGRITATYHVIPTANKRSLVTRLEKTVIENTLVATRE